MIDIDSFKKLNDEKGHLYGDQILFEIGKNLSKYNSANSIAARYGGDEFLLLFTAADIL
jgi:diguanylate cyclase (GGDEF)-like protein